MLTRLTDGHYDLVFCDADKREYGDYLTEALRLLRPGGVVAFDNALWHDRVADPASVTPRRWRSASWIRVVREDDDLVSSLLPVGDGLLVAVNARPTSPLRPLPTDPPVGAAGRRVRTGVGGLRGVRWW